MGIMAFLPVLTTVIDKIFPDADSANKARLELMNQIMTSEKEQLEVNKIEAGNQSIFVSGWRPALGWICVFAFAYTYVVQPIVNIWLTHYGYQPLPTFNSDELYTVLMGMLGLGGLRSIEKIKLK
jgi:hypothetical protein